MIDRIVKKSSYTELVKTKSSINLENEKLTKAIIVNSDIAREKPLSNSEKEIVSKVVDGLNDILIPSHKSLKFEYHEKLNEYYVTLVDDQTKEVVKEIPSKKMLDFYASMTEAIGLMIDKKI